MERALCIYFITFKISFEVVEIFNLLLYAGTVEITEEKEEGVAGGATKEEKERGGFNKQKDERD